MENKKQTAVEWLIESLEKLEYNLEKGIISLDDYIINVRWVKDQAKAMEKEQIIEAFENGEAEWTPFEFKTAQDYYTSTYGS
jgi:hypothetical protein